MRVGQIMADSLQAQRGAAFSWLPVFLAIGIGAYFALPREPGMALYAGLAACLLCATGLARWRMGSASALVLTAFATVATGFLLAAWRAHDVAAPVLGWRYYGPVEGRLIGMDRSASDAIRLTLDQVTLPRLSPDRIPARVRISLHGVAAEGDIPPPGARIMTTAHISPPGGPVEPGGFDFQRHSWFLKLGGVGYTRVPVVIAQMPEGGGLGVAVFRARVAVANFVRDRLPGDVGGFGAAITAGDRSGMGQEALEDLRASNLAHLLAISGLHMGLLTGFVFAVVRYGLVLIPYAALYWPTRGIAAFVALVAGAFYLALSGGNVATERAFVMAAVALTAVMLNRRAISIRSVAIAALIVLTLRPEALLSPGFQMSFAATTALVAVFSAMRDAPWKLPKWAQSVSAVFIASAVSGLATAPIAAAHFNAISHYGLMANVISVPVMGTIVVPAAVVATLLTPLGLEAPAFAVMGWGLTWILKVAAFTADLPGARSFVPSPSAAILPVFSLCLLVTILWQGRWRWLAVVPALASLTFWNGAARPDMIISDTGGLVGVMTPEGRAVSKARGSGFIAENWLENDGDGVEQAIAHARWLTMWPEQPDRGAVAMLGDRPVFHVTGKKATEAPPPCQNAVLVVNASLGKAYDAGDGCDVFDPARLRRSGAIAFWAEQDGSFTMRTAREVAGDRLWSQWE